MKILAFSVAVLLAVAGCTGRPSVPVSDRPATHPPGTNIGTSNPGVNQGTQSTTATRSTDS